MVKLGKPAAKQFRQSKTTNNNIDIQCSNPNGKTLK